MKNDTRHSIIALPVQNGPVSYSLFVQQDRTVKKEQKIIHNVLSENTMTKLGRAVANLAPWIESVPKTEPSILNLAPQEPLFKMDPAYHVLQEIIALMRLRQSVRQDRTVQRAPQLIQTAQSEHSVN